MDGSPALHFAPVTALPNTDGVKTGAMAGAAAGEGASVTVVARTVGGALHNVEASGTETVGQLKRKLAEASGIAMSQQKLVLGSEVLHDALVLGERGVGDSEELCLVVGPKVPEWAESLGLGADHPHLLRSYFEKNKLEAPSWMSSDDAVWERTRIRLKYTMGNASRNFNSFVSGHGNSMQASSYPGSFVRWLVM